MDVSMKVTLDDKKLRELIVKTAGGAVTRYVADGVDYGLFPEMGTVKMAAHPFMRPAVESVRPGFGQAFKGALTLDKIETVVEKAARDVERLAKANAPVDTGALRNSIHVEEP